MKTELCSIKKVLIQSKKKTAQKSYSTLSVAGVQNPSAAKSHFLISSRQ